MTEKPKRRVSIPIVVLSNIILVLLICNIGTLYFLIQVKKEANQQYKQKDSSYSVLSTNYDLEMKDNERLKKEVKKLNDRIDYFQQNMVDQSEYTTKTVDTQPEQTEASPQPAQPEVNNPPNAITIGSTKQHVREVMGVPTTILTDGWWYGNFSWVKFDNNGLVKQYYNGGNNLKNTIASR